MKDRKNFKKGQVLILGIIFMAVILIFSTTIFSKVSGFINFGSKSVEKQQAIHTAEAGIDLALRKFLASPSYTGETNTQFGQTGTFTTTISTVSPSLKTITSTGFIPNATAPRAKQTITVDLIPDAQTITFDYAVSVGDGGLIMNAESTINGDVSSLKTGSNSIYGNAPNWIYGNVKLAGLKGAGITVTGTVEQNQILPPLPTFDYTFWKTAAEAGGTLPCPCTYTGGVNLGPKKLLGDLILDGAGGGADLRVDGPLWVTGDIILNNGYIWLNNNFINNGTGTVIIADGSIKSFGGYFQGSVGQSRILAVTTSSRTTSSPLDINSALFLDDERNNAIFYALNGTTTIWNDGTEIPFLVTKKLFLNEATIDFDSGAQTSLFSTSPTVSSWKIDKSTYHLR